MWNCRFVQAYNFRSAEIALCKMFAAQKIFARIFAESILHDWPTFSANALALERKKKSTSSSSLLHGLGINACSELIHQRSIHSICDVGDLHFVFLMGCILIFVWFIFSYSFYLCVVASLFFFVLSYHCIYSQFFYDVFIPDSI
jgi:hypothetical protein